MRPAELPDRSSVRDTLIMSKHFYSHTPPDEELRAVLQRMRAAGAAIPKVATTAQDVVDALRILLLAQQSPGAGRSSTAACCTAAERLGDPGAAQSPS